MFRTAQIVLIAISLNSITANAAEIFGIPRIVDGDTVQIGALRIRLSGIDAPEPDQVCLTRQGDLWKCGVSSREELIKHSSGGGWRCQGTAKDRFGRLIATCEVNGENIQAWMVRNGWALSFVRFSHLYDADEATAREAGAGLWSGAFIAPWEWRNRNRKTAILGASTASENAQQKLLAAVSAAGAQAPGCDIKGNVNRSGECIYHPRGSRWYSQINMELNGKRWFCSAQEAEAAGCRLTKR